MPFSILYALFTLYTCFSYFCLKISQSLPFYRELWRALVIQLLGGKFEGWLEGGNPVGHRVMLIRRPH